MALANLFARAGGAFLIVSLGIIGSTRQAQADCVINGTVVICSGATPAGFGTGTESNLTVNVLPSATVGTGINIRDGNQITNQGTVSVGANATAVAAANNNQVANRGAIVTGDDGFGISLTGAGSAVNTGSILGGDNATGIFAQNITNDTTGTITLGDGGIGIVGTMDFGTLINHGTIVTGDSGVGIVGAANALTVLNSGSIQFGDCGVGIDLSLGSGHTVTNSGTIRDTGCGGAGIMAGDDSTVTNTGTITVGDGGTGIMGGTGMNVVNTGTIIAGPDGFGILIAGGNALNTGTIIVGDGTGFSSGMISLSDGAQLANTGTIIAGDGAAGMLAIGNSVRMMNSGTITVGIAGPALTAQGDDAVVVNTGTINVGSFGLGLGIMGDNGTATNAGTINVAADATGMAFSGFNNFVRNTGTINVGACGVGIDTSLGSASTVVNSGRVIANGCSAIGVALGDGDVFSNSGLVSGPVSVATFGGNTRLTNTGTLDGALLIGGLGDNTLTNSGLITVSTPLTAGNAVMHLVDGTFFQTGSGTLAFRVLPTAGAGDYDTLLVVGSTPGTGNATLGGTLRALPQSGLYGPSTTYSNVLTFTSASGRFATVETGLLFLSASAIYNANGIDLVLTRVPFNQAFTGGGANAQAVGNVLEANYSPNLTGPLATFYSNLLQSSAPNTLSQLTGEIATAVQTASFTVFGQFLGTVFSQTGSVRNSGGEQVLGRRSITGGGGTRVALASPVSLDACSGDTCGTETPGFRRVTAWAQGFGGAGSIDRDPRQGSSRVDLVSGGGATGIDVQFDSDLVVGVTMGGAGSSYNLTDLNSSGSARSVLFGLYGGYSMGPAYVDAALGYSYGTFNTTRFVGTGAINERIDGAYDGYQYGGRIETGWRFAVARHTFAPFAGLTVQNFRQNGYSETSRDAATGAPGVLGLAVQPKTTTSVRSQLGGQIGSSFALGEELVVSPRLRLAWAHEFNTERSVTATFNSLLPGSPFSVAGAQAASDALVLSAGVDIDLTSRVRLYAQFDGDFASNAQSYAGTGGIRLFW